MKKVTIIGAGLAGSLLAIYLAKKGFAVDIYERRPDMRKTDIGGAGRSINLALSARGIHALQEVGLYSEIKKISIPMYGRYIHFLSGETMMQPYGKDDTEYINSVSRAELNKKLMELAEGYDNVKINFNMKCTGINFKNEYVYCYHEHKGSDEAVNAEVVIAADGSASQVRMEMLKQPRFNFSQVYENYGYKELTIPPGRDNNFQMLENALHIWPRGSYMLIALPNMDKSFTCTLFMAYDKSLGGEASFEYLRSEDKVISFFKKVFPDAIALMPELKKEFFANPVGSLITIKCFPWAIDGKVALLGDAAHAIVPFFGQGMNAAFEDCTYLSECIDKYGDNWDKIFRDYQEMRKINTDAIADLAQENFIEMRDLVDDPKFILMKKIESELAKKYPDKFIPKYTMVTFRRLPYAVARDRGRIQENILKKLSENVTDIDQIDWVQADRLIKELPLIQ